MEIATGRDHGLCKRYCASIRRNKRPSVTPMAYGKDVQTEGSDIQVEHQYYYAKMVESYRAESGRGVVKKSDSRQYSMRLSSEGALKAQSASQVSQ